MTKKDKKICIGKIAAPHGIKGLVKIIPYCENLSLLEQVSEFKITLKNPMGKYMLAEIDGVQTREASEALKGTDLYIDRSALPDPEDGEFYYEDLVGLKAVNKDGKDIGIVKAVQNFGAGELLELRLNSGQDILIPFDEQYVGDISDHVAIRNYEVFLS